MAYIFCSVRATQFHPSKRNSLCIFYIYILRDWFCGFVVVQNCLYRRHFIPGIYARCISIYRTLKTKKNHFEKKYVSVRRRRRLVCLCVCVCVCECIWSNNIFASMFSYNSTFYLIAKCRDQLMNIYTETWYEIKWERKRNERNVRTIAAHATGK